MIDQIRRARSELAAICLRHNVRRLDLFGSAVGSDFDPASSDLDFLVEFGPFPKGGYSEHYFGLIFGYVTLLYPGDQRICDGVGRVALMLLADVTDRLFETVPFAIRHTAPGSKRV